MIQVTNSAAIMKIVWRRMNIVSLLFLMDPSNGLMVLKKIFMKLAQHVEIDKHSIAIFNNKIR